MNATHPLKILMPPGRRRDDSEKPQSPGNLFTPSEKEKGINYTLAFDNRHAFRDDKVGIHVHLRFHFLCGLCIVSFRTF